MVPAREATATLTYKQQEQSDIRTLAENSSSLTAAQVKLTFALHASSAQKMVTKPLL